MMNRFDLDSYWYISTERKSKPIEKASADREGVVISGLPVSKVLTSSSRQHFSKAVPADWTAAQIFSRCMCGSFNRLESERIALLFFHLPENWKKAKSKMLSSHLNNIGDLICAILRSNFIFLYTSGWYNMMNEKFKGCQDVLDSHFFFNTLLKQ